MSKKRLPQVLIIDRGYEHKAYEVSKHLHWTDSSGSRSVVYWNDESDDYELNKDLPVSVFKKIKAKVPKHKLCIRREDPGLGIWIPELDERVAEAGGVPDGCIMCRPTGEKS